MMMTKNENSLAWAITPSSIPSLYSGTLFLRRLFPGGQAVMLELVRDAGVAVVWLILELLLRCGWCGAPTIENVGRWREMCSTFRGHEIVDQILRRL